MDEPVRNHGLEWPFHPFQVVSWAIFGIDVLTFCIFVVPLINTISIKAAIGVFYAISVGVLVLAAVKTTGRDPADPHLLLQEAQIKVKDPEGSPFCDICNSSVMASSKHCRACNKCVHNFDHHCMWLNNCIGERNYHPFIASICSVVAMTGIVLVTSTYLLVYYFTDEEGFEQGIEDGLLPSLPKDTLLSIIIVTIVVNLPLFVLDIQLVILHAFLASQNLTTYEYIMNKRSLEDEHQDIPELSSIERPDKDENAAANGKSKRLAKPSVLRNGFRSLPRCMDWIVFVRCYKRRRRRKDNIEHIGIKATEVEAEVAKRSHTADLQDHSRSVMPMTPPGAPFGVGGEDALVAYKSNDTNATAIKLQPLVLTELSQSNTGSRGSSTGQYLPNVANPSPREAQLTATNSTRSQASTNDRAERESGEVKATETPPGGQNHNRDCAGNNAGIVARLGCGSLSDRTDRGRSQSPAASV